MTVPACLLGLPGDLVRTSLSLDAGRIASGPFPTVDMAGAMVLPAFVDMHTHLDKGHIWGRSPNPNGTFTGALTAASGDRESRWSALDVRRRMDFALRSAFGKRPGLATSTILRPIGFRLWWATPHAPVDSQRCRWPPARLPTL